MRHAVRADRAAANPENKAAGVYFSDSKDFLLTCVLKDDGTFALTWFQVNFLRKSNLEPHLAFWEGGHDVVDGNAITLSMEYGWNWVSESRTVDQKYGPAGRPTRSPCRPSGRRSKRLQ